jgi:prolyl oligopeptidase
MSQSIREQRTFISSCRHLPWFFLVTVILTALVVCGQEGTRTGPPPTRTDNVKEVLHGVEIVDPYRWLEDRKSPETQAWIEAQNQYTQSVLASIPGREKLARRLTELMKIDTISAPVECNGRYFFEKRLADQELFIIYMRQGLNGADQVLIDPHPMSPDRTTSVDLLDVSRDGRLLAYGVRHGGQDEVEVRLLDVDTRKDLPDRLPRADYFGVALKPDRTGLYYARHGTEGSRVYYHALGQDPTGDTEVFGKGYGPEKIITAQLSEDGRYLLIHVIHGSAADKTEIYYQDVAKHGPIGPVVNDVAARFFGAVGGNQLFMHTNWKAAKGRILAVDLENPARDRWREIIPETDAVIENIFAAGGKLLVEYTRNVSSQVRVFEPSGKHVRDLVLPAIGRVAAVSGRWESSETFYAFDSYTIPMTIYRYDAASGEQEVWARLKVPVDSARLEVKQVWYESKDGTKVPMFLVSRRDIKLDGAHPTLLSGYGGFNLSEMPRFLPRAVLWAEHGGVFAVANLRGGGEFGEEWHKAAMLEKKQNVFDDFVAAAQWLVAKGYTQPGKLAIAGTSNGGLLVGAALTQRPELFGAVACGYPVLDMLRYHKFLVAQFWVPEYGSAEDPDQFKYLYAYSPYHHVKPGTKYPAVLFFTGDSDTRVDPLHARKMAALLQAASGSGRPVLLRYETKSGHSGGLPLSKEVEQMTDVQAFLLWQLGVAF